MRMLALTIGIFCLYTNASKGMTVTQPAVVVASRHGKATLICGYKIHGKVQEMRFSLLKETDNRFTVICASSYTTNYEPFATSDAIRCEGKPGPSNVTLHVTGLQPADTGLYICMVEVMYPPPYRTSKGNATLIYISDLISEAERSTELSLFQWVLLAICLTILFYSIFITAVLLFSKLRKRRWSTGDYEAMLESSQEKSVHPYYIRID
ncbi:cytotoxic T-lymphocyte protein 4 [Ascaphus truei]|uniref:cytotoxic T-lymphocyte protein 4 n=1 Tax=Ascaphus truei TaxID=8439 RepID=UPI003F59D96A